MKSFTVTCLFLCILIGHSVCFNRTVNCDFEAGRCGWTEETDDDLDWIRLRGRTASAGTGPNFDHTLGDYAGHYIYLEASSEPEGAKANIRTPTATLSNGTGCLEFWYDMLGPDVGSLHVLIDIGGKATELYSLQGNQMYNWHKAQVEVVATGNFSLIFSAVVGKDYKGDIALDDVTLSQGACPEDVIIG